MKKSLFSGWRDVFAFTLKETAGEKFQTATIILALIMLIGGMSVSILMAVIQKKDATNISSIETVHVIDESGLAVLYLDGFEQGQRTGFPKVAFQPEQGEVRELAVSLGKQSPRDVILQITYSGEEYLLSVILPYETEITKKEGEKLGAAMLSVMEQSKLLSSDIPMEKLAFVMSQVRTTYLDAGEEEKSIGEELVSMLFPMAVMFLIYFMVLVYGQSIGNIVSVEKSSKLMEMLLTLTRPYGIIFGKILAVFLTAVLQMLVWILSLVIGFVLGDYIAGTAIYPGYINYLLDTFALLRNADGSTAFSAGAMILAVITICISFLFFCLLAGMIASFASKAEELAQVMSYYQMIMVAGFFGAYLLPLQEKEWINRILRFVPLTGAFLLPGDLVVGNAKLWEGAVSLLLLLATSFVLVIVTGRVYRDQLFYKGKKLRERLRLGKGEKVQP